MGSRVDPSDYRLFQTLPTHKPIHRPREPRLLVETSQTMVCVEGQGDRNLLVDMWDAGHKPPETSN